MVRHAQGSGSLVAIATIALSFAAGAQDRPAPGFADAVLGRWDLTVEGPDGSYPSWLEVRLRTEWQLMADLVGQFGSTRHAAAVAYDDGTLTVRAPPQYEAGEDDLLFTGRLEDGALAGRVRMADGTTLAWRGVRAPSLGRGEISAWADPVSLIGEGIDGWRLRDEQHDGCWKVTGGILAATMPCADLISEAEFTDFRLRLEFRYPAGSNSGVYLRGRYEVQVQDDFGKALDPLRLGGIYGFIAPAVDAAKPAGAWQTCDILIVGRRVTVALNGTVIIRDHEIPGITGGALDSDEGAPGPLMLQGDHGPIEFRNIVITPGN
ncbi:MAG: DUF1080 domain-containing protein [Gammaproteobacteria bacterium]|nr:DUF1080 domain-containing protein [Gammaproteobacteria bacterium]